MMKKTFMRTVICVLVLLTAGVMMTSCGRSNVMESDEDITAYVSDTFDDQISEYGDGADVKITDEATTKDGFRLVAVSCGKKLTGGLLMKKNDDGKFEIQQSRLEAEVPQVYFSQTEGNKTLICVVDNSESVEVGIMAENGDTRSFALDKDDPSAYIFSVDTAKFGDFSIEFRDADPQ